MMSAILPVLAQSKYEKEVRIRERYVPQIARDFVDQLNLGSRIKWYQEFGKDTYSFEAKTRYNGSRISIEFSYIGVFEDVEIEVKITEVPHEIRSKIIDFLNDSYPKYQIDKIQVQYSGSEEAVLAQFTNKTHTHGLVIRYELVLSAKKDGQYSLFEYLFSENGSFVSRNKIVLKTTDNLEY